MNRRLSGMIAAFAFVLLIALAGAASVSATQPADMHCPDGWVQKTEAPPAFDAVVLPAGTQFCVKAANDNSGIVTADGTTSIGGYITWLTNGGQTPDGSYWALYSEQPSTPPPPTPDPSPSASPSPSPSSTPTPTLTPSPTHSLPPTATLPPTDTTASAASAQPASDTPVFTLLVIFLGWFMAGIFGSMLVLGRTNR